MYKYTQFAYKWVFINCDISKKYKVNEMYGKY